MCQPELIDSWRHILDEQLEPVMENGYPRDQLVRHPGQMDQSFSFGTSRGFRRYDLLFGKDQQPFCSEVMHNAAVHDIAAGVLGDANLHLLGALVVGNTNIDQKPHFDGRHLNNGAQAVPKHLGGGPCHMPPHCVHVFLPLVDVDAINGATAFAPGTHRLVGVSHFMNEPDPTHYEHVPLARGDVAMFDYRIWHFGGANHTSVRRPVLYYTFTKPWFKDTQNYMGAPIGIHNAQ